MKENEQFSIFIVEDVEESALLLKNDIESTFGSSTIKADIFQDGEDEFKKSFIENNPQIVILDYNLNLNDSKAANGIEVLKWIKKENDSTKVIMLTVVDNLPIKPGLYSIKNGASDYIIKTSDVNREISFSLAGLFELIKAENEAIKGRRLRKIQRIFIIVLSVIVVSVLTILFIMLNPSIHT